MGDVTSKPQHYPEKVRDMLLGNSDIPKFIEETNNMEFANKIITNSDFLDFVTNYKEFWEFVVALSYGATNIPLRPRKLLTERAEQLANALSCAWYDSTMVRVRNEIGFELGAGGEFNERIY